MATDPAVTFALAMQRDPEVVVNFMQDSCWSRGPLCACEETALELSWLCVGYSGLCVPVARKLSSMSLESTLALIVSRLRQGRFQNEQAVSQGIVLPVFHELGWDTRDTDIVWPEFQTGEGRADFALCHPQSKPTIFIEVKQPGRAEDAVRQALEYAFHVGVPFVVLTDGRTWSFYLPAEQGSYEDRRVYKLDLYERPVPEAAAALQRYLDRGRVQSGEALETARKEYRSRNRQSQAKAAIPVAWRELVEKGDELLVEILTAAVESRAGIRPDADDVAEFLAGLGKASLRDSAGMIPKSPNTIPPLAPRPTNGSTRSGNLVLCGKVLPYNTAKDAMVSVLREFAASDPLFLERCSQHPDMQGRKRRYIARKPEELYPDRDDLRDLHEILPGGWLVATNLNNVLKKTVIRVAAEVAGLKYGKDVVIEF